MTTAAAKNKYGKLYANDIALLLSAEKGLKPSAVFDFISVSKLPPDRIEKLLGRTIKTFTNYKNKAIQLDPATSEKLLKLFSLYEKGIEVFGTIDGFNNWMLKPAFGLGGQVPEVLTSTITGIGLVEEEVLRIAYGNLA